jgi:hypothetical protein
MSMIETEGELLRLCATTASAAVRVSLRKCCGFSASTRLGYSFPHGMPASLTLQRGHFREVLFEYVRKPLGGLLSALVSFHLLNFSSEIEDPERT